MERPRSLLEAIDFWGETSPSKTALTFLDDAGVEIDTLTYSDVLLRSNALAAHLVDNVGLSVGSTCLLVYPPCLDFTVAYLACLRAGVIAVPCFPPDPKRLKKDLHMFTAIQGSSGATVALTKRSYNYAKKVCVRLPLSWGDREYWIVYARSLVSWGLHCCWTVRARLLVCGDSNGDDLLIDH